MCFLQSLFCASSSATKRRPPPSRPGSSSSLAEKTTRPGLTVFDSGDANTPSYKIAESSPPSYDITESSPSDIAAIIRESVQLSKEESKRKKELEKSHKRERKQLKREARKVDQVRAFVSSFPMLRIDRVGLRRRNEIMQL